MIDFVRKLALASIGAVLMAALVTPAAAQSDLLRRLIVTEDADYAGNDYQTLRNIDLDACTAACLDDMACRALTYNVAAGWCFLKNDFGALAIVEGAVAARVVTIAPIPQDVVAGRQAELLEFLASDFIDASRRFEGSLGTTFPPGTRTYSQLIAAASTALNADDQALAANLYGAALAIAPDDIKVWIAFARATLSRPVPDSDARRQIQERSIAAAVSAYLRATDNSRRAEALTLVGLAMEFREAYRTAIRAYRASLALEANPVLEEDLRQLVAQHGFRIVDTTVDADSANPRICVVFSDPLPVSQPGLTDYVVVEGGSGLALEPEANQICVDGVRHGQRYDIRVRPGLPSADGEMLGAMVELSLFVRDRAPWAGFAGNAYVLPAVQEPTIPVQSVNADRLEAEIYRIGDRGLVRALQRGIFLRQLDGYDAFQIAEWDGELVFEGEIDVAAAQLNEMVTTAIPVTDALDALVPGVYAITVRPVGSERQYWEPDATQWFVVSDLGMTALSGSDGTHVFVRSLQTAEGIEGVRLSLVARNNDILGEAVTDADGYAAFAPGLTRGQGGLTAELVVAETAAGDYGFIDLTRNAFDLTDRGVDGRAPPDGLDVYLTTERGVYRPGETVFATWLVRDSLADAVTGLPLTVVVERPDGVEHRRDVVADGGLGGYVHELVLQPDAMRGSWRIAVYADPDGASLAERSFLVEDFEPERLAFELTTDATMFDTETTTPIEIAARYLYGATAPGLTAEGEIAITAVSTLPAYPGYLFGREDDRFDRILEPIDAFAETDEEGNAVLDVALPFFPDTTRLLRGEAIVRLTDTSGRAVERRIVLPVRTDGPHIGVRPLFDGYVPEGAPAEFDVIAVDPDGGRTALEDVAWTLLRVEVNYQWYNTNGVWRWQAVTTTQRVADGTIDLEPGQPARISAPVDWGSYRLELVSAGSDPTSTTYEFWAGWYYVAAGTDTPDVLEVALDKPAYALGETAMLRLDPQFPGIALVTVVDDRLITMTTVEVPEEGTIVELPVTEEWGPGAYVTATLYRPIDVDAGRMPARALGVAWADVEPGDRDLAVSIDLPEEVRPRGPLTIPVQIDNLQPGTEAYVVVTAVDLGILNLTNYRPPAPDDWYFGQRRLGMEFRDLYGLLIDTMQGAAGAIRSGGDGGPVRLGAPPPTAKLVAFHSGIVEVGEDGTATVSFPMPDFNGTVRVMVQAWSAEGVGHAVEDVFVRDPVVVVTTTPRFLHLGDTSRLLVEINNVSGPAGDYRLLIDADAGVAVDDADGDRTLTLAENQRVTLAIPITAAAISDTEFRLTLVMPGGERLPKDFLLGVRAPGAPLTERTIIESAGEPVTIDASFLDGFVSGTATVTLAAGSTAQLDLPGVLASLSRYPYGCVEQTASRAMPLLYLNQVAASIGIGADAALEGRIRDAIAGVLAKQASNGAFGLWGPYDDGDLWLDAYIAEFLTRAIEAGYEVPQLAMTLALDNLANNVAFAADFTNGGQDIAYALYVLAMNGRASIGDLRYYAEARLGNFGSALAKAQIGAALALYGDRNRAEAAFAAAAAHLATAVDPVNGWRLDYGTVLRDRAAVLALAAEARVASVDLDALADRIVEDRAMRRWTSTQEDAWTLMAAAALLDSAADAGLTIDGMPVEGEFFASYFDTEIAASPVVVATESGDPFDVAVTVIGVPEVQPKASSDGFTIERRYFLPDGTETDVSVVAQNDRFVVTLTVTASEGRNGRLLIVDPLPAGFEIENPNLSFSGDVSRYPWLVAESYVDHTESRTDRFVAAVNRFASAPLQFTVAYTVRAVSPGVFIHPGATIEDMYRPERRANTDAGTVEVVGPTR
ncbi:MAG: alpha-2-macroglobulin family protein [Bauldia sp.]|nr:alpha-2-macroglobulin family protein [Bauldia sp.]